MRYQKDELASTVSDAEMIHRLRASSGPQADLPPLAFVELVQVKERAFRARRLHNW